MLTILFWLLHKEEQDSGKKFIAYVKLLYKNASCLLKVNNSLCYPFPFQRGILQGCALSGMLYNLSVEPLLVLLRNSMLGVSLSQNSKVVVSAYADDICVAIANQKDVSEVSRCLKVCSHYHDARHDWNRGLNRGLIVVILSDLIRCWGQSWQSC